MLRALSFIIDLQGFDGWPETVHGVRTDGWNPRR